MGEPRSAEENWRDLRDWLSAPLERMDEDRLVKVKWHTESILRAMDRLDAGESVYENLCGYSSREQ